MPTGISLSNFEAVLFDVDGTLVDSIGGLVAGLQDTFQEVGNTKFSQQDIRALIGIPLVEQMKLAIGPEATPQQIQSAIEFTLGRYAFHQSSCSVFEPTVNALKLLHQNGWKTALVTSKNAQEMQIFMPKFEARTFVDAAICASDVTHPKPHPESIFLACELLNTDPAKVLMIGDSVFDIRCANAAQSAAIAVSYGSTDKPTLQKELTDLLFERPEDLFEWVQQGIFETHEKEATRIARRTG